MWEFEIQLRSVRDVQEFVALATTFPFPVRVGNDQYQANGKSFMEMFCLNFSHPLIAVVTCTEAEYQHFRSTVSRFLVN